MCPCKKRKNAVVGGTVNNPLLPTMLQEAESHESAVGINAAETKHTSFQYVRMLFD
jgi:hypothetical protein